MLVPLARRLRLLLRFTLGWLIRYHVKEGGVREEVTHETLFAGPPSARRRRRRSPGGLAAADRPTLPRQSVLYHPLAEAPPPEPIAETQAPRRGTSAGAGPRRPDTSPPVGAEAARRHASGVGRACRRPLQPHGHLPHVAQAEDHPQEEVAPCQGAGLPARPAEATGLPRRGRHCRSRAPGLHRRDRGQHGDDPDLRPGPTGPAGPGLGPRPLDADLRGPKPTYNLGAQ